MLIWAFFLSALITKILAHQFLIIIDVNHSYLNTSVLISAIC
ncbi:hypothetical protein ACSSV5_000038 [Psychroflexus sp. MBR-150]